MGKIKKVVLSFICFVILFTLTGCGDKVALTPEEFKNKMEFKEFSIQDATSQMSDYDYIEQVYLAISKDSSYQIEFYELSDNDYAMAFFNNNKEIFEDSKSSSTSETSVSIGNNNKYTLTTDGSYKVVSRIDNTVIYVNVYKDYKETVKDILDELGY